MMVEMHAQPDSLVTVNGVALLLRARGIRPNTRYSVLAAIARSALPVAARSQWGVLLRREDVERYAEGLMNDKAAIGA